MTIADLILLLTLPALLVFSAFFSGSETALFSLSGHQRIRLARDTSLIGQTLTTLLGETRGLLITLLLTNMTVNVMYFALASVLLFRLGRTDAPRLAVAVASVAPLIGIILFGEVLPKLIAARLTTTWARLCALPLYLVHRTIAPVRLTAEQLIIAPLARLIAPRDPTPAIHPDELDALLQLSQKHGVIGPDEEQLLQQVLELNQIKVRDLMTPRVDIVAHDLDNDPADLLELIRRERLRHIPIYEKTLDDVRGLVFARQVLLNPPTSRDDVTRLIRQIRFVPEQQRADQLLVDLRKSGTTIAIVVDEYGGTAGLITLEDVVEHMVGEIPGDYEREGPAEVVPVGPNTWRVSAELPVYEWAEFFRRHAMTADQALLRLVSTVGGLVMAKLGRLPQVGDRVRLGNVQMTVETMLGKRIGFVLIELVDPTDAPGKTTSQALASESSAL